MAEAAGLVRGTFEFETTVLDLVLTGNTAFAEAIADVPEFMPEDEADVPVVPLEINESPSAGQDSAEVEEDGTVDIPVLGNDTDPEDDALSVLGATDPNGGTAEIVDNEVRFSPAANFFGQTEISYELGDSAGNVVTGSILVDVSEQPDPPVAVDDQGDGFSTDPDTPFTTGNVLDNDTDPDSDTLTVIGLNTTSTLGIVSDNGDGTFGYDPNGAFAGLADGVSALDSFDYTISDGNGGTSTATVQISVLGAEGEVTTKTRLLDDGREIITTFVGGERVSREVRDGGDVFPWEKRTQTFDAEGGLSSILAVRDNGVEVETTFSNGVRSSTTITDVADEFVWTIKVRTLDEDGQVQISMVDFDDGRTNVKTYTDGVRSSSKTTDLENAYVWANRTATFNDRGERTNLEIVYDDGRVKTIDFTDDFLIA